MAKLSVIIPCFNNGNYLKEMMDCCIRQTFKDWELIIVDDQSTDNETQKIGEEYAGKDERIKFFVRTREPKGSVVCRNIGFDLSSGEYIIHFDADDLISDTCFEKRVQFMDEHSDCDYASFPAVCFSNEDSIPTGSENFMFGISKGYDDILDSFLKYDYCFSTWNNIYRRISIKNIQWDEKVRIYTDFSFIVPCILKGLKHLFSNLSEADYYYRVNHSNIAMTASFVSEEKNESTLYLINKTLNQLKQLKDFRKRKKQYLGFIIAHYERLLFAKDTVYMKKMENLLCKEYSVITLQRFKCTRIFARFLSYKKYALCIGITLFLFDSQYLEEFCRRIKRLILIN